MTYNDLKLYDKIIEDVGKKVDALYNDNNYCKSITFRRVFYTKNGNTLLAGAFGYYYSGTPTASFDIINLENNQTVDTYTISFAAGSRSLGQLFENIYVVRRGFKMSSISHYKAGAITDEKLEEIYQYWENRLPYRYRKWLHHIVAFHINTFSLKEYSIVLNGASEPEKVLRIIYGLNGIDLEQWEKLFEGPSISDLLSATPTTLYIDTGNSGQINVTTQLSWTAEIQSSVSWASISPLSGHGNGRVTVTANSAAQTGDRCIVTFSSEESTKTATVAVVYGKNVYFNIVPNRLSVDSEFQTVFLTVTTNMPDTYKLSVPGWCSTSTSGHVGSDFIDVNVSENTDTVNSREGQITFYNDRTGTAYGAVLIKQAAKGTVVSTLSVVPLTLTQEYTAGTLELNVISNISWTATSDSSWCTLSSSSGFGNKTITLTFTENTSTTSPRTAIIKFTGSGVDDVNVRAEQKKLGSEPGPEDKYLRVSTNNVIVSSDAQNYTINVESNLDAWSVTVTGGDTPGPEPPTPGDLGAYKYSVGLISDIHFHTLNSAGNRVLQTKSEGNSNNDDASSLFKEDFKYLISVFETEQNFAFIASPGDIATYDLNDFIYFTDRANAYLGGRPLYCATGNHDHGLIYYEGGLTDTGKFLNPDGTKVYGEPDGTRWKYITDYQCPETLGFTNAVYFLNNGSYYVNYGDEIYVFIMLKYGSGYRETGNNRYITGSQVQPHNRLDPNDSYVIKMKDAEHCNKPDIFTSGNETNFNFQYYAPNDLIYLSDTIIRNNPSKRIFVFMHHFFTNKAGNNDNYHPGGSTCLMGLTLHFLNWINDNNKNVFFFTGHSHISWKDTTEDLLWTNKKFGYKAPTSAENAAISDNGTWNVDGMHYYHNMWKVKAYDDTSSTVYDPYYKTTSSGEGGWNIHLPSMSRPVYGGSSIENACEAAILRIYENGIRIEKIGYTTNDSGTSYIPYDTIAKKTLTVYNNGDWEESGGGGGGDTPEPGILTDNCMEIHIDIDSSKYGKYNSHIRFEFEDGGYLHMFCGGAAEEGSAWYAGKYSPKYGITSSSWTWDNLLIFVGDTIPSKFRYLCYDWGLAFPKPTDETAWIYKSEFFSEGSKEKRAYYGNSTGDIVKLENFTLAYWLAGSDKTEFINSMKSVLTNYLGKKLKSSVLFYYYDSNYVEQSIPATLTDVCYYSDKTERESIGLYFVNGQGGTGTKQKVRYKITIN